mmetsp:Transcript_40760/g.91895  ORF Transcript_40760/g.91895 Transcript_40760/m.91895 type:complete len:97 (+) Transcript_40760:723-1013(+)
MPWLSVDGGKKYGQSAAVARYVGKIASTRGRRCIRRTRWRHWRCGVLDAIDIPLLEPFPALKAHKEKIASLPPIKAYYDGYAGPGAAMRAPFKVGA